MRNYTSEDAIEASRRIALTIVYDELAHSRRALLAAASHAEAESLDLAQLEAHEAERVWVHRVQPILGDQIGGPPTTIHGLEAKLRPKLQIRRPA